MIKRIFSLLIVIAVLVTSGTTFGDDNADTGDGDFSDAADGQGFYRSSEYMYKVSVYVGLSDTSSESDSLNSGWHELGNQALYVKPASFTLPSNALGSTGNKIDYINGQPLSPVNISSYITDSPPPPPITNGGNIEAVKSYFGDTNTLIGLIDGFAAQESTTREGLLADIYFTIDGVTENYLSEEILPVENGGQYQNKVPWLVIYEPVIISYLKDGETVLAFTATEYALAQKEGYFNFKPGTDGQYIAGMTHSDLPNSIFLEESWFGYPITPALADGVHWDEDRIISGGGWGMRMLRSDDVEENDTTYDYEYRIDTEVITSVRVFADEDVTPDNRHFNQIAYLSPSDNTATVTMAVQGYTKSTEVVIPKGGSQLVWIKWRTPEIPSEVDIYVEVTGNQAAMIDEAYRSAIISANVVDMDSNPPPDPTANDTNDSFEIVEPPDKADKPIAQWGEFGCHWVPDFIWYSEWIWISDWQIVPEYGWVNAYSGWQWQIVGFYWEDWGYWLDVGQWIDGGYWEYDYTNYYASLTGVMSINPDEMVSTASGDTMKSGYGINIDVNSHVYTNAPNDDITYVQNAITYFPEFGYETYWRLLEMTGYGEFEFKENDYSTYANRTHFTPIWYPDTRYIAYTEVIDMWTPDGMLRVNLTDSVNINGNLYEDWHIGPK